MNEEVKEWNIENYQEEKFYFILRTFALQDAERICVYCNHCKPCPVGIDVGLVNKYYDLAL